MNRDLKSYGLLFIRQDNLLKAFKIGNGTTRPHKLFLQPETTCEANSSFYSGLDMHRLRHLVQEQ
jgi:hypothetical protein